ncbi:hypothetical protein GTW37_01275 [Streptomyces sp. SID4931]|nr:hypothetical protein [Streptomyces sp. SID4931]SCF62750.1 hypothetical protein GA0115255_100673 [Streptomyces sp. Ncost-T6T-2b]
MANAPWLRGQMDLWCGTTGCERREPCTEQDCEATLAQAARAVTGHLGAGPERTLPDNGPYGHLTHLQLSLTPLSCVPELPPAADEKALEAWITAHIDW